ncbi:hypothetical protein R3P38DRAFT_3275536 [Favolaschia claudopus]|uniref:ATP synthase F0 subunit 8 n=1 Tax=Favolaschia claudopus TaxID=2862362 RepID=A0AAW0AUT6_9AGAR
MSVFTAFGHGSPTAASGNLKAEAHIKPHCRKYRAYNFAALASSFPSSTPYYLSLVFIAFAIFVGLLSRSLPSCLMKSLEGEVQQAGVLYDKAVGGHFLAISELSEFSRELLALDTRARQLRMRTLALAPRISLCSFQQIFGLFNGHSLAIWMCIRRTQAFRNKMQLLIETKQDDFNSAMPDGIPPSRQLWLRHRLGESIRI